MNANAADLLVNDLQPCPKCGRYCNFEHVGREYCNPQRTKAIVYLYCEDCDAGWETLLHKSFGRWMRDFVRTHGQHNPVELALFRKHLEESNSVAA